MPPSIVAPTAGVPDINVPLQVVVQAPWLGSLIALLSGVIGVLITAYTLRRVEANKLTASRKSDRDGKSLDAVVEVIGILDRRLQTVVAGGWTPDQETAMWSAITRLTILGPKHLAEAAYDAGEAMVGLEAIKSRKLRLIKYQLTAEANKSEFLRLAREYFEYEEDSPGSRLSNKRMEKGRETVGTEG